MCSCSGESKSMRILIGRKILILVLIGWNPIANSRSSRREEGEAGQRRQEARPGKAGAEKSDQDRRGNFIEKYFIFCFWWISVHFFLVIWNCVAGIGDKFGCWGGKTEKRERQRDRAEREERTEWSGAPQKEKKERKKERKKRKKKKQKNTKLNFFEGRKKERKNRKNKLSKKRKRQESRIRIQERKVELG